MNTERLLTSPLGTPLLDVMLGLDLYAVNAYRLLGLSAASDKPTVDAALQRSRTMARIKPEAALSAAIPLGYQALLDNKRLLEALAKVSEPRYRLLCEVFWPHLASVIEQMRSAGDVAAEAVLEATGQQAQRPGLQGLLAQQARAVIFHNQALTLELFARDSEAAARAWELALVHWRQVIEQGEFWQYLERRVRELDDPRLSPADVGQVRANLGAALLGVHQVCALAYDRSGDPGSCERHVRLVVQGPLNGAASQAAMLAALQPIVERRVDTLMHELGELRDQNEPIPRSKLAPVVDKAFDVVAGLAGFRADPTSSGAAPLFNCDRLAQELVQILKKKLDYRGDARAKNLLFGLVVTRRMADWPLTATVQRDVEQEGRDDVKYLLDDLDIAPAELDLAKCYFLEHQWADADASLEYPVHQITEVTAAGVRWKRQTILVPRSRTAKLLHEGKLRDPAFDAKARALKDKLQQQRAECQRLEGELTALVREEAKPFELECEQALSAHRAQHAEPVAQAERTLLSLESTRAVRQEAERRRVEAVQRDVAAEFERRMAPAQVVLQRRLQGRDPVLLLGVTPLALLAGLAGGGSVAGWSAFQAAGSSGQIALGAMFALTGGFVCAMLRDAVQRRRCAGKRSELSALSSERETALAELSAESEHSLRELDAEFDQQGLPARELLTRVREETSAIERRRDGRVQAARARHGRPLASARQECDKTERELAAYTEPKPLAKAKEFTSYRRAKDKGYRDGVEPSDEEANERTTREFNRVTAGLDQLERLGLALLHEHDKDAAVKMLRLLSQSPYEAKQQLRSLALAAVERRVGR